MIIGLLLQVGLIALVVFGIRAIRHRQSTAPLGSQLRNIFHGLVLLVLLLASASGLAGLLGMVIDRADFVAADSSQLALNLSLTLVGTPLLIVVGLWTKRRIERDPEETASAGWTLFVTVALIVGLIVSLFGAYDTIRAALGAIPLDGFSLAQFLVWGVTWLLVDRLDLRVNPNTRSAFRHILAALIGLGLSTVGVAQLIAATIERVTNNDEVVVGGVNAIANAAALLAIGAPVWIRYWAKGLDRAASSDGWRLYVVLFGVAGGLITAIAAGATMGYSIAVWFLGTPQQSVASEHFDALPGALGAAAAGLLVWAYHRAVLTSRRDDTRREIDRTYDYVMAAGGLVAAAVGAVILFGAFIEALTGSATLAGDPALNTLLLAVILLAIGVPVWWVHWQSATRHRAETDEIESVSRRVYVVALIGIGGLVALGTGIATINLLLQDLIDDTLSASTLRSMRFPLATLMVSGAIALTHLSVFRTDQADREVPLPSAATRRVVLVGPFEGEVEAIVRYSGATTVDWLRLEGGTWDLEGVRAALSRQSGDIAIVLTPTGVFGSPLSAS